MAALRTTTIYKPVHEPSLVDLRAYLPGSITKALYHPLAPLIEDFLGITALDGAYRKVKADQQHANFFDKAMASMGLAYTVSAEDLAKIPTQGPLFVVANHPFGGADGIVLGALLNVVRPDYKLLANYLLGRMTEIEPWLIPVDPFGGDRAARFNLKAMRDTMHFVREGGCVATFPSGTVSHFQLSNRQITDPAWNTNIARLAIKTKAQVVPIFFEGCNSCMFQALGTVHPRLRTLMLPREMKRIHHKNFKVRVGNPIPYRKLVEFPDDHAVTDFLRLSTYILGKRAHAKHASHFERLLKRTSVSTMAPIIPAIPKERLEQDVGALPVDQLLVQRGEFKVYHASAVQIPNILREIGRLREKTFRDVHEGTGEAYDLDRFDPYYQHLFMWDDKASAIVGAYRLGLTDKILSAYGKDGLYTSTLFKYKDELMEEINPALEVGRSFIVSEYQKKHATLSMIWRGIGHFVVKYPQYKLLFGPVSINSEYMPISRDLMVRFLRENRFDRTLSSFVRAKRPPRGRKKIRGSERRSLKSLQNIEEVSALVSEIEKDQKGVPVLLKHYLKMNGKLLSFNVDHEFGDCLDGLIMVDLTQSDRKLLKAYLSPEGMKSFLNYHGAGLSEVYALHE